MTSITDLFADPLGKIQSLVNSITKNSNLRYPAIFALSAGGVFVASFLLILLLSGLGLGLIYGVGTFISHFFSGFIISAFTQGSLAFLSGLTSGFSTALLIFPAFFWGITNIALLTGTIAIAWTVWKNPGMVSNNQPLSSGDPEYQKAQLQAPLQPAPAPAANPPAALPGANPYQDPNLQPPINQVVEHPPVAVAPAANGLPAPLPNADDLLAPPLPPEVMQLN